jgi:hypothetical protein
MASRTSTKFVKKIKKIVEHEDAFATWTLFGAHIHTEVPLYSVGCTHQQRVDVPGFFEIKFYSGFQIFVEDGGIRQSFFWMAHLFIAVQFHDC